jgi:hypothetical protein
MIDDQLQEAESVPAKHNRVASDPTIQQHTASLHHPQLCSATAVAGELDPLSGTLDRSFGEVQQDLLLSCLTIG